MRPPLLSVLTLAALTAAPARAADGLDFEIAGVEEVSISASGTEATVVLRLTRTKWPALVLTSTDFDLVVSGETIGRAGSDEHIKLRRDEPAEVRVRCELSAMAGLSAALSGLVSGDLSFKLAGEAGGRVFIFPVTFAFDSDLIEL